MMFRSIVIVVSLLYIPAAYTQVNNVYMKGLTAEQNLKAINDITPYTTGGMGFDSRYEGVKGSPRLYDTLCPSMVRVQGQNYYINLESDLDIYTGRLVFTHPRTGSFLSLPADYVSEAVLSFGGRDNVFRTTKGLKFDKEIKETRFFQVLNDTVPQFIKMPVKLLIEADYKALYSPDRRYDEFDTRYRYYIMGDDSIFHQVQLNKRSLTNLFPAKKAVIERVIAAGKYASDEAMVLKVLREFYHLDI